MSISKEIYDRVSQYEPLSDKTSEKIASIMNGSFFRDEDECAVIKRDISPLYEFRVLFYKEPSDLMSEYRGRVQLVRTLDKVTQDPDSITIMDEKEFQFDETTDDRFLFQDLYNSFKEMHRDILVDVGLDEVAADVFVRDHWKFDKSVLDEHQSKPGMRQ